MLKMIYDVNFIADCVHYCKTLKMTAYNQSS